MRCLACLALLALLACHHQTADARVVWLHQGPSGTFTTSSADAAVDAGPFTSPFSDYRQQQQQQEQRHDEEEARGILSLVSSMEGAIQAQMHRAASMAQAWEGQVDAWTHSHSKNPDWSSRSNDGSATDQDEQQEQQPMQGSLTVEFWAGNEGSASSNDVRAAMEQQEEEEQRREEELLWRMVPFEQQQQQQQASSTEEQQVQEQQLSLVNSLLDLLLLPFSGEAGSGCQHRQQQEQQQRLLGADQWQQQQQEQQQQQLPPRAPQPWAQHAEQPPPHHGPFPVGPPHGPPHRPPPPHFFASPSELASCIAALVAGGLVGFAILRLVLAKLRGAESKRAAAVKDELEKPLLLDDEDIVGANPMHSSRIIVAADHV